MPPEAIEQMERGILERGLSVFNIVIGAVVDVVSAARRLIGFCGVQIEECCRATHLWRSPAQA